MSRHLARNARFGAPTCLVSSHWLRWCRPSVYGESCKTFPCWRLHNRLSCRFAWQAWHFVTFQHLAWRVKVVLCGRRKTFATFSDDALQFSWQAQRFGDFRCHFAMQAQHFRRVVLRVFWESHCQRCAKWWHSANSMVNVAFCDMWWKRNGSHTLHMELYTHTLHSTLSTPHLTLYTPHFTLHTLHFPLHPPHFILSTPHLILHTLHFTLHTSHFLLHTVHFTLHTLHSLSLLS